MKIKRLFNRMILKLMKPAYIDRILKIAQGNARLAIMCAKVALIAK